MSKFEREERYIIIKLSKLTGEQLACLPDMHSDFSSAMVDAVVVEADWPEYGHVWEMIERRVQGMSAEHQDATQLLHKASIKLAQFLPANAEPRASIIRYLEQANEQDN